MIENELYLTINKLIFEGFDSIDQEQLKEVVVRSLEQLINENGFPNHLTHTTTLWNNKIISTMPLSSVQTLGRKIAETIYQGR